MRTSCVHVTTKNLQAVLYNLKVINKQFSTDLFVRFRQNLPVGCGAGKERSTQDCGMSAT